MYDNILVQTDGSEPSKNSENSQSLTFNPDSIRYSSSAIDVETVLDPRRCVWLGSHATPNQHEKPS